MTAIALAHTATLTADARRRLAALEEFQALGSGYHIAMRDLEIRGAGNLLGSEQHGHMEAIGFDLYCRLLDEAVRDGRIQRGETGLLEAFGGGFTWGSIYLKWAYDS